MKKSEHTLTLQTVEKVLFIEKGTFFVYVLKVIHKVVRIFP